jgi:O-methyltransferase
MREKKMSDAKTLYLDLMKRCLTNFIYGDWEAAPVKLSGVLKRKIVDACIGRGIRMVRVMPMDREARAEGRDWPPPPYAHSMIGFKRLNNLQFCIEDVLDKGIPGDFIETGVWRGGATIFMRAVLKAYNVSDRLVWIADSFEGLPPANEQKYPQDAGFVQYTELAVSVDEVKSNFEKYGLLDDQVRFLKGWFKNTLPHAPIQKLAVLRLDGDMYESTMDAIINLYPKLSIGGYLIVDDYGAIPACRPAIHDYRESQSIQEEIRQIDWTGIYWKRSS